jgi:hypothetical protein
MDTNRHECLGGGSETTDDPPRRAGYGSHGFRAKRFGVRRCSTALVTK